MSNMKFKIIKRLKNQRFEMSNIIFKDQCKLSPGVLTPGELTEFILRPKTKFHLK